MKLSSFFALASAATVSTSLAIGCQATQDVGGPGATPEPAADAGPTGPLGLRAFVTSATFTGDLVSAAGGGTDGQTAGDALCATAAKGAGLDGIWIAYLSSGVDAAKDHVVDDGPFYAVDGKTKLYASKLGIGGGAEREVPDEKGNAPTDVSAGFDKFGNIVSSSSIASFWTGSSPSGEVDQTCRSWMSPDLFDNGTFATYLGTSTTLLSCQNERHLLCLEQRSVPPRRPTKKLFVTRKTFTGDLGGLSGADAKCAAAAADGGLEGTFVAWLSGRSGGSLVRAADRLGEARYVMLDGTIAFESKTQLTTGPSKPILVNELGVPLEAFEPEAWTGTLASGTPSPDYRCLDWSSSANAENGIVGEVDRGGAEWSATKSIAAVRCNESHHLYCFEK
jgi:hypothetical protein